MFSLKFRCAIPECEDGTSAHPEYYPDWLNSAVPMSRNGGPARCERFVSKVSTNNETETCSPDMFYHNKTLRCDRFVFNTKDTTILNDVSKKDFNAQYANGSK